VGEGLENFAQGGPCGCNSWESSSSDRELAVAKLEGLKKKLRNLIKSKKSARDSRLSLTGN
jgi:hypothetical protein